MNQAIQLQVEKYYQNAQSSQNVDWSQFNIGI